MTPDAPEARFGELRALLARERPEGAAIVALLLAAHDAHPAYVREVWAPYLSRAALPSLPAPHLSALGLLVELTPEHVPLSLTQRAPLSQLDARHLGRLETARLRGLRADVTRLSPRAFQALLGAPALRHVEALSLIAPEISRDWTRALIDGWAMPRVHALEIVSGVHHELVEAMLEEITAWRALRALGLRRNALGGSNAAQLVRAPTLQGLTRLSLAYNGLRDEGVQSLVEAGVMPRLRALSLAGNGIRAEGAQALATSPRLARLDALDLSDNRLGAEGVRALLRSPHLQRLSQLTLHDPIGIEPDALQALVRRERPDLHVQTWRAPGGLRCAEVRAAYSSSAEES